MTEAADTSWVAIVEDDAQVQKALGRLLRAWSFNAVGFSSGEAFLRALGDVLPLAVVLDLQMPTMSGLEVQLALAQGGQDVPVVIITAHDDPAMRARCLAAGAVAFLRKPIEDGALLAAVRRAVQRGA